MGLVPGVSGVLDFEMALCPQDKPVVCLANQNGSQVECELGNPMKRGAQVSAPPKNLCPTPPALTPTFTLRPPGALLPYPQHSGHHPADHRPGSGAGPVHVSRTGGGGKEGIERLCDAPHPNSFVVPRISEQPTLEPVVARARVVIELPLSVTG